MAGMDLRYELAVLDRTEAAFELQILTDLLHLFLSHVLAPVHIDHEDGDLPLIDLLVGVCIDPRKELLELVLGHLDIDIQI